MGKDDVSDPPIAFEHAEFAVNQFVKRVTKFTEIVTSITTVQVSDVPIKENELLELRSELNYWQKTMSLACSVLKDGERVYDLQQVKFDACKLNLDKVQKRIAEMRDFIRTLESKKEEHQPLSFKLKRIQIPTFSGNFSEWEEFKDIFFTAVHNNNQISNSEKMVHLKTSLTGEALQVIHSFTIKGDSYKDAWDLLVKRYSSPREIAFAHLNKIFHLQRIQDTSSDLRKVVDLINELTRSMKQLQIPVESWDVILCFWLLKKLDQETRKEWLLTQDTNLPVLPRLIQFLENRAVALDDSLNKKSRNSSSLVPCAKSSKLIHHTNSSVKSCYICDQTHPVHQCQSLLKITVPERKELIKRKSLCFNCLGKGHSINTCKSKFSCRTCNQKHHTLLHQQVLRTSTNLTKESSTRTTQDTPSTTISSISSESSSSNHVCSTASTSSYVLLQTALVDVIDAYHKPQTVRILIDSGSDSEFIKHSCVNRLGLQLHGKSSNIIGFGGVQCQSSYGKVSLTLRSKINDFSLDITADVVNQVTGNHIPQYNVQRSYQHLSKLKLADPTFYQPAAIDLILGCRYAAYIKTGGLIHGPKGSPSAEETLFGWVLSGPVQITPTTQSQPQVHHTRIQSQTDILCPTVTADPLQASLSKFWETEEISVPSEDFHNTCETIFTSTTSRRKDGRFEVMLPFRPDHEPLGDSLTNAINRYLKVEHRIHQDKPLLKEYLKYFQDNLKLGILEVIPQQDINKDNAQCYYMPYREVIKDSSSSTKCRIVYDASAKTINGPSLNDVLFSGPKLQVDLLPLLIRFRMYPYVISSDIVKFFNQFCINANHKDFQRLVYRESPSQPIQHLRFTRITFGVTCAPYLSIRCLHQLFEDECEDQQIIKTIKEDVLVDNILTGTFSKSSAVQLQTQLRLIMAKGQLHLRKWASNDLSIIESIPVEDRETQQSLSIYEDPSLPTLGLKWNPTTDEITNKVPEFTYETNMTKRTLLSAVSKIYDPLGILSPIVIRAKILLQDLWKLKLAWDDPISKSLNRKWQNIKHDLLKLSCVKIPRCYYRISQTLPIKYELIGFCDASNIAYCGVLYLRSIFPDGTIQSHIIGSKTKVAPLKGETTPRMELMSARLLVTFASLVLKSLPVTINQTIFYSDSTSVIGWLYSTSLRKGDVFIVNRVRYIHQTIPSANSYHIPGTENPADFATRGVSAEQFQQNTEWLNGPAFLQSELLPYVSQHNKIASLTVKTTVSSPIYQMIMNTGNLYRMQWTVATTRRLFNLINQTNISKPISVAEWEQSLHILIKTVQQEAFSHELQLIADRKNLSKKLKRLTPFVDKDGIIRVGGRLQHSKLGYNAQHPILLPKNHHFSKVLARQYHVSNLHAGPSLLLSLLRTKYWIYDGPALVKNIVNSCIVCHRQKPKPLTQLMGELPETRVSLTRPFLNTGMDFAGPFILATVPGRKPRLQKFYICVFVCHAVKAVHLELVGDLTSASFIAALQRFVSRRGRPCLLQSDGGTNFVGAKNELAKIIEFHKSKEFQDVQQHCTQNNIQFKFNPPLSPHHGGLFEAAVKSVKYHLKRIIGDHHLSIQEFETLLCLVESNLNSRPLTPMSNDPSDFQVLTPGHFLILDHLHAVPQEDFTERKIHSLKRWQLTQQLFQQYSKRFHEEYLHQLQARTKWLDSQQNISVGTLVLVKESDANFSSHKWYIGRIQQIFPGPDGRVRVVKLKLSNGQTFLRPITKISPLPIEQTNNTN